MYYKQNTHCVDADIFIIDLGLAGYPETDNTV